MLSHSLVLPEEGAADRFVLFLHGILGSGANWRSFARELIADHPGWGAVLVDLRMHGRSLDLPPPHTIAQAAEDLCTLRTILPGPAEAVIGHSFGGKVALAYAGSEPPDLRQLYVLDSLPGARSHEGSGTEEVLSMLESAPFPFERREAFKAYVTGAGHSPALAAWLAMNLRREADGRYAYRLSLPAIRALLMDYFRQDLWPTVERLLSQGRDAFRAHLVIAGRSTVFSEADRERALGLVDQGLYVHEMPEAGHWLHVDDPAGLMGYLSASMKDAG